MAVMECACDICEAERRRIHPWEMLFSKYPKVVNDIHADWIAGKVKKIWEYDNAKVSYGY